MSLTHFLLGEPREHLRKELLDCIVALDIDRILSRLRSKHAARTRKTVGKQGLILLLDWAVNHPSIKSRTNGAKALLAEGRTKVSTLKESFEYLERLQTHNVKSNAGHCTIKRIIEQVYRFTSEVDLKAILSKSTELNPNLVNSLPTLLGKVGRYCSLCHNLVDAARDPRYTIFRRITVEILTPLAIDRSYISQHPSSFDDILNRVHKANLRSQLLTLARQRYASRMRGHNTEWKVHAEIQLLFFYEASPGRFSICGPRVICSSKSACYLCHLFFQIHGRYRIFRTHGRLYDRWTLPDALPDEPACDAMLMTILRFNKELEAEIRRVINGRRLSLVHPNESVTIFHPPWSPCSTLACDHLPPDGAKSNASVLQLPQQQQHRETPPGSISLSTQSSSTPMRPRTPLSPLVVDSQSGNDHVPGAPNTSPDTPAVLMHPIQAAWSCHQLPTPDFPLTLSIGKTRLHLSWNGMKSEDSTGDSASESCWVGTRWIDLCNNNNPAGFFDDTVAQSVDLDRLGSSEVTFEDGAARGSEPLWVRRKTDLLVVKFAFGGPPVEPAGVRFWILG